MISEPDRGRRNWKDNTPPPQVDHTGDFMDDPNEQLWKHLRARGPELGDVYLQAGMGPARETLCVLVDGVAMSFKDARALDQGVITLKQIAQRLSKSH